MALPLAASVQNPSAMSQSDGNSVTLNAGRQSELLVSEIHGKWYYAALRGNVFSGQASAITVPVIANNLVSVFSLYNPAGSKANLEVISVDLGLVLATTVVNVYGLYFQSGIGSNTSIPTSQTVGTATSGNLVMSGATVSQGKFLTAATHVGTPTLITMLDTFGAVTSSADNPISYTFDGKLILPPGSIVSLAASTAASTASGMAASITWAEWPL